MTCNFSFAPQFSQEAVDRYPSLTSALGNYYPGLSQAVSSPPCVVKESPQLDYSAASLCSVQVAPYEDPYFSLSQCTDNLTMATTLPLCSTSPLFLSPKFPKALAKITRRGKVVKKYPCDRWCQRFSTGAELRKHSSVHVGEARFSCSFPGCLKEFGAKSNLMRHEGTVHRKSSRKDHLLQPVTFEFSFMDPEETPPPVRSDTTAPAQIIWDYEGPLVRRRAFVSTVSVAEIDILSDQVQARHPIVGYSLHCS
ncbi:hypothetical protein FB45DRAFT_1113743 [Roridomyces roridus]|uniref:C2H2-type domain-containing protein n=1 Tax=Roridomyces roridus TaxID=1738132 RepID=A0AAD7CA59_9AGAR|nr:hypothetical protein FB45DRAFT_1113743 [Roridomyces roridus]